MESRSAGRIRALVKRFHRVRVLVVGDLMLDEFIWGRVDRISPEAPVPVVRVTRESIHLGGAANVVHNLCALGGQATVCGLVGADRAGRRVLTELKRINANTSGVISSSRVVTIRKTRIVAHNQQVVRFDHEAANPPPRPLASIVRFLEHRAGEYDVVLVSDYGKGAVDPLVLAALDRVRQRHGTKIIVDPKKLNYSRYRNLTLATPNTAEALEAAGVQGNDDQSIELAGQTLLDRWQAQAILITRGEEGMSLFKRNSKTRHFPTVARAVFDVTGAGDTVTAVCALALGAGASFEEAALLANHAAGVVVGKVGTATVGPNELVAACVRP